MINCLIIDDEPASQSVVKTFIDKIDFLQVVKTCGNALEAVSFLQKNTQIDLLFLDINMPAISGLSFYKSLTKKPLVIFTTAYPQYALDGFEVNAVDYLLKPFSFDRFLAAVHKVVDKLASKNDPQKEESILIKADKKLHKINLKSIYYIEAYGDYVKVYLENTVLITYSTFASFLTLLSDVIFLQIHKSYAINLRKISFVEGNQVVLHKYKLPIGLTFKKVFLEQLKKTK